MRFDFEVHGEAKVGLSTQYTPCVSGWPADPRNVADIVWLALAIFVTSAWLLWLTCINITRSALTFFRLRALCRIAVLASREHGAGSTTSVRRPTPAMITQPSVSRRRGSSTADLVHARLGVPLVPIVAADDHDPLLEGKDSTTNPSLALPQHAVPSTSLGSSTVQASTVLPQRVAPSGRRALRCVVNSRSHFHHTACLLWLGSDCACLVTCGTAISLRLPADSTS